MRRSLSTLPPFLPSPLRPTVPRVPPTNVWPSFLIGLWGAGAEKEEEERNHENEPKKLVQIGLGVTRRKLGLGAYSLPDYKRVRECLHSYVRFPLNCAKVIVLSYDDINEICLNLGYNFHMSAIFCFSGYFCE